MLRIIYIKGLIIEHAITHNTSKPTNQYTTDAFNNYKTNKVSNLKKSYYNFIDDVVINKHNTMHSNENTNVTEINKLFHFNDNNYFAKKIEHTSNTINNITRHNHNNYEHNVINKVNKHSGY